MAGERQLCVCITEGRYFSLMLTFQKILCAEWTYGKASKTFCPKFVELCQDFNMFWMKKSKNEFVSPLDPRHRYAYDLVGKLVAYSQLSRGRSSNFSADRWSVGVYSLRLMGERFSPWGAFKKMFSRIDDISDGASFTSVGRTGGSAMLCWS